MGCSANGRRTRTRRRRKGKRKNLNKQIEEEEAELSRALCKCTETKDVSTHNLFHIPVWRFAFSNCFDFKCVNAPDKLIRTVSPIRGRRYWHNLRHHTCLFDPVPFSPITHSINFSVRGTDCMCKCITHSSVLTFCSPCISVFNQLDVQNLFHNKFYFMPVHVSSTCAHHQEVKIALHSLWYHHTYRCSKHVQA